MKVAKRRKGNVPMDLFDCGAVLFESQEGEEALRIECAVTPEGALEVMQESDGPLTSWCFEESPHRIEVVDVYKRQNAIIPFCIGYIALA